jgi:hypothetical protein
MTNRPTPARPGLLPAGSLASPTPNKRTPTTALHSGELKHELHSTVPAPHPVDRYRRVRVNVDAVAARTRRTENR